MAKTTKRPSSLDGNQTLQGAFNDDMSVMSVDGFVANKVGHKIERTIATTTVPGDTEVYSYLDGGVQVMELTVVYSDSSLGTLLSVERTA